MELHKAIKAIRFNIRDEDDGYLTHQQLANMIKVSRSAIGHYEANLRPPKASVLRRLLCLVDQYGIKGEIKEALEKALLKREKL